MRQQITHSYFIASTAKDVVDPPAFCTRVGLPSTKSEAISLHGYASTFFRSSKVYTFFQDPHSYSFVAKRAGGISSLPFGRAGRGMRKGENNCPGKGVKGKNCRDPSRFPLSAYLVLCSLLTNLLIDVGKKSG